MGFLKRRLLRNALARPRLQIEPLEDRTVPSFYAPVGYTAGTNPYAIVTADFNGDSRLDLAVVNANSDNVSILLGNGDGTFQAAQNYTTGAIPESLAVGDFNGDGKLDIVTANADDLSVLPGNGDGTFGPRADINIGSGPRSVAVGDFNADGKLDLGVTSNVYYPGTPGYWVVSWGYYGDYSTYYPGTPGYNDSRVNVLLGQGDGTFTASSNSDLSDDVAPSIATGDFNGDGKRDLAWTNAISGSVGVLPGNGDGTFADAAQSFATDQLPNSIAVADLNGDGKSDLVTANEDGSANVLLGKGDGSFRAAQNYVIGGSPYSVACTDFNGDGNPDLATASLEGSVGVLLGNGDGSFRGPQYTRAGQSLYSVTAGDFNGDGRPDLAVADWSAGVSVLLNTEDWQSIQVGGFPSTTTAGQAHSLTVTALDSDGSALTSYRGTVHFSSTDPQADLPADYTFTAADNGSHTFDATLKSNWTQSITVADTNLSAFSDTLANITVNPADAATFRVSEFPSPVRLGSYTMFAASPFDAFGNLVTNYRGTITLSSTDPAATFVDYWSGHQLPGGSYTFTESNGGAGYFYAALNTAGSQSITATDTANLAVTGSRSGIHVNPLGTLSGPTVGLPNQTLTYTFGAVSGLPASTVFTYAIDWNGDGVTDQTVSGPSGTAVNHSYTASGGYYIRVTATVHIGTEDFTGYAANQSLTILPVTATVQADPGNASKSALVIDGTAGSDSLVLSPGGGNSIALTVNGYSVGTFSAPGGAAFAHLLVYGNGGADTIRLTGNLSVPAFLFGGDGNDILDASGSTANNVLIGGAGNETLVGGSGRDLLVGGLGADTLRAGNGGAILIGGTTDYDTNVAALLAIMKEWGRTDADYNTRVKHLNGSLSGGLNGSYRLTTTTVHDDATIDNLYGGAGLDWFLVGNKGQNKDRLYNQVSAEVVTALNR
jgi:hypothetical protein